MKRLTLIRLIIGAFVLLAALFFFIQFQNPVDIPTVNQQTQAVDATEDLKDDFTLKGQIPVTYGAHVEISTDQKAFTTEAYNENMQKALQHKTRGKPDVYLYEVLDDLANQLLGKKVVVVGSKDGWYESILLAYGATPVVIVNKAVSTPDPRLSYVSAADLAKHPQKFAFIIDILGVAKEGLGAHEEPFDSNGDLKAMVKYKEMLEPKGKLILAIPIGLDEIVWNSHRIYGKLRLKPLLQGWRPMKYYGFLSDRLNVKSDGSYQPVFLLEPK